MASTNSKPPTPREHLLVATLKVFKDCHPAVRLLALAMLLATMMVIVIAVSWFGSKGWAHAAAIGSPGAIWSIGKFLGRW